MGRIKQFLGVVAVVLALPHSAAAAFQGGNGKIAFTSERAGPLNLEIYSMSANGSNPANLSSNAASDSDPAWSPDGSKIAFSTDRDNDDEVYVMNADGGAPTRLTSDNGYDGMPAWSPDGQKIAYVSEVNGPFNLEIYVMNADGSGKTRLTNDPEIDTGPAWSPDGSKIAFTTTRDGSAEKNAAAKAKAFRRPGGPLSR